MISARTEKERLRALIGLDGPDNNLGQTALGVITTGELPHATELVSLLQKQDQIINELYGQLDLCKREIYELKDQNAYQTRENQKVFEELRAQILKQNLAKAVNQISPTSEILAEQHVSTKSTLPTPPKLRCDNCQLLNESLKITDKEKHLLKTKLKQNFKELTDLKTKEDEHLTKIRQAVQLADRTLLEKAELEIQWKQAEQKRMELSEEIKTLLKKHQKSLEETKNSVYDQYNIEVEGLKSQVVKFRERESQYQQDNERLLKQCETMKAELTELLSQRKSTESELEKKIMDRSLTIDEVVKEKKNLEKSLKSLTHKYDSETQNSQQKFAQLNQNLVDQIAQLQSTQSTLNRLKKENGELREQCALLEKDVSNLRLAKRRLQQDKDVLLHRSSTELKETLRMTDLKQEQTKTELEQLLNTQNSLITKLKEECKIINDKMARMMKEHKREVRMLKKQKHQSTKSNLDSLSTES